MGVQYFYFSGIFFLFCFAEGTLILPLVCLFVCIFPSRKPIADPATVIPLFCKAGVDTHVGAGVVTLAICPSRLDVTVLLAFPSLFLSFSSLWELAWGFFLSVSCFDPGRLAVQFGFFCANQL